MMKQIYIVICCLCYVLEISQAKGRNTKRKTIINAASEIDLPTNASNRTYIIII